MFKLDTKHITKRLLQLLASLIKKDKGDPILNMIVMFVYHLASS